MDLHSCSPSLEEHEPLATVRSDSKDASGPRDNKRPADQPTSSLHFTMHARHSWLTLAKPASNMPWDLKLKDQFDFVKRHQNNVLSMSGIMPPVPPFLDQSFNSESSCPEPGETAESYAFKAIKNAHKRSVTEQLSYERRCANRKWLSVVAVNPMAFEIARVHYLSGPMEFARGGLSESIKDALGDKASSTLHNRAGPLLRYVKFWSEREAKCFPLRESQVYDFVKACVNEAPSFPRSFMLSVSFATHILGLMGGKEVCSSKRIAGAVRLHYADRAKVRQRPPLTVNQVQTLERVVHDPKRPVFDRIMAGFFLVMVYGRLRFSDAQRISGMKLDVVHRQGRVLGFLECSAERTKVSVSLESKVRFLPIAVPVQSLINPPWLLVWNELREGQGLSCDGKSSAYPVMPSPASGGWSKAPVHVTAAGEWLRSLLKDTETIGSIRIATHSCKCTLLSWAAKFGIDYDSRRMLGYHSKGSDQSLLVYSRDAMSAPLRLLIDMLDHVADCRFEPDLTRSGILYKDVDTAAVVDDATDDSSQAGSEDEDDADPCAEEAAVEQVAGQWSTTTVPEKDNPAHVRHVTSRCIHKIADESGPHLARGRTTSRRHEATEFRPKFFHPACGMCFKDL